MKQSYIQIFENGKGGVTLAYAPCGDDLQRVEIESILIQRDDLFAIGTALIAIDKELDGE